MSIIHRLLQRAMGLVARLVCAVIVVGWALTALLGSVPELKHLLTGKGWRSLLSYVASTRAEPRLRRAPSPSNACPANFVSTRT